MSDPWDVFDDPTPPPPKLTLAPPPTQRPAADSTAYAQAALTGELDRLSTAIEGQRNDTLFRAAANLYELVNGGALLKADVDSALAHAARSIGLHDVEIRQTLRSAEAKTADKARTAPERDEAPTPPQPGVNVDTGEIELTPEEAQAQWHARQVAAALRDLRIKDDASRAFKAEVAAASFREPPSVWTLADELLIPDEPVTYAIDELLPTGANALLAAQFKTGKTTFINNYARAFADGTPFLGRYNVNPAGGRIALYNYELDPSMNRRWLRDMNIQNPDRVVVLNLRGFRLPITAPSVEDWVVRWLAEREVTAWVVDPFARASVGLDENSNSEVGVWLDTLDIIKSRAGVRDLVLPTHTGRAEQEAGQERARGATRLDDWADVRWLLTKDENDNRFFRATGRDVDVPEELVTFRDHDRALTIGGGDRKWVKGRDAEARVFAFIKANPGAVTGEIERSGGNKGDNATALKGLTSGMAAAVRIQIDGQKHRHYVNREEL